MKILIACEYSGTVREAFSKLGHEAWSCDLLETEIPGNHYQCDVRDILCEGWDLMIAHPPCTHLAVSGARWFKDKKVEQAEALEFVRLLLNAPIERIALENPISIISSQIRKPDQIIQPYEFGHPESKATCLWLKGLPLLTPTEWAEFTQYRCKCGNVFDAVCGKYGCCDGAAKPLWQNQTKSGQNKLPPSKDRAKLRSRTYPGIAQAMATQWGNLPMVTDASICA
jgi:site-specific DNA-cytosine methylase